MKKILIIIATIFIFTSCEKTGICSYEEGSKTKRVITSDKDVFYEEHQGQNPECN